jgi:DNA-binding transcriptional LysR family regulator
MKPFGSPTEDIETFVAVAQNASFTRAAELLGTGKSSVGKAVQRLEARLGTRLFQRTTRAVHLTEDGETYLDAARAALDGLKEAQIALAARRKEPAGRVRLDVPVGFGRLLLPVIAAVRAEHPKVSVELSLSDRHSDAVAEGWDIVVRASALPADGEMTVRKLCDLRLCLYASPAYLAAHGVPMSVRDIASHQTVIYRTAFGRLRPWTVLEAGNLYDLSPRADLIAADGRSLVDAAIAGLGIAQLFDKVAAPHLRSGELVPVLPEVDAPGPAVHALIPLGRRMPPKTRLLLDRLGESLR